MPTMQPMSSLALANRRRTDQTPAQASKTAFSHDFARLRVHTDLAHAPSSSGRGAHAGSSAPGMSLPTGLRPLAPSELSILPPVYGSSVTYVKVLLSDATGLGGAPFTTVGPSGTVIINIGSAAYTSPGSNPKLLIHETAHVWQSQHHSNPAQFMVNSVESQTLAPFWGGDPYCYIPGKPFSSYAAEQIAESAENGEAAIVAHMAGVAAGATDADNVKSLSTPNWEKRGASGVKC
jgi:hypothetical protein